MGVDQDLRADMDFDVRLGAHIFSSCGALRKVAGRVQKLDTDICQFVLGVGGGSPHEYRRERRQAPTWIVRELYSSPRVVAPTNMFSPLRLIPGLSPGVTVMDEHREPWDFSKRRCREQARRL